MPSFELLLSYLYLAVILFQFLFFRLTDRISISGNSGSSSGSFTHLTVAEINAGIDGLILSEHAGDWEQRSEITLSQIIDMYYTPFGVSIAGKGPTLAACDRYANYFNMIDANKLKEQAYVFGYEYKSILVLSYSEAALRNSINLARTELDNRISLLDAALNDFGPCSDKRRKDKLEQVAHNLGQDERLSLIHI